MVKWVGYYALGWLLLGLSAISSADTPEFWLERMVDPQRDLTYRGRFVYVQGQNIESMEILFQRQQGREQQRLTALNDTLREIIVGADGHTYIITSQGVMVNRTQRDANASAFPLTDAKTLNHISTTYHLELRRTGRIAGRHAVNIAVSPRDHYRFGYDLWLDQDTATVLRSALLDENQQPIETMTFVEFEPLGPLPEIHFQVHNLPVIRDNHAEITAQITPIEIGKMPVGFQKISQRKYQRSATEGTVEQIVFSDGLATVSVFLEVLDAQRSFLEGPYRIGVMSAYGRVLNNLQITAIGEVPIVTTSSVANSLQMSPLEQ